MDADLDNLCTAVYVTADDLLPARVGNALRRVTDAELVTLALAQAVMGIPSDRALSRRGPAAPGTPLSRIPGQSGYHEAPPAPRRDDRLAVRRLRRRQPRLRRRPGAARLHPGRVRALDPDRAPLGPGRLGRLRLEPQPLAFLLGMRLHLCLRPGWHAAGGRAVPGRPPRARGGAAASCSQPARRRDRGRRQGLCRARLPGRRGRARRGPGAPGAPTSPATAPSWGSSASASSRSFRRSRTCSTLERHGARTPEGLRAPHRRSPARARRLRLAATTSSAVHPELWFD